MKPDSKRPLRRTDNQPTTQPATDVDEELKLSAAHHCLLRIFPSLTANRERQNADVGYERRHGIIPFGYVQQHS